MSPIPKKIRKILNADQYMKTCVNCKSTQHIEFNHALIYSGRQIQEVYSILPLCTTCHRGYSGTIRREIKDFCELIAITRGTADLVKKYPRFDWITRKNYLTNKLVKSI